MIDTYPTIINTISTAVRMVSGCVTPNMMIPYNGATPNIMIAKSGRNTFNMFFNNSIIAFSRTRQSPCRRPF